MAWFKSESADLYRRLETMSEDLENAYESNSNLRQAASQARAEANRMKLAYTEEGLNQIALVTARRIEDLFILATGGRDARLEAVQAILREVMRANLTGATNWKGPY